MLTNLVIDTNGQGLTDITNLLNQTILATNAGQGLCTVLIQHTSASLLIQENADPSARHDLQTWLNRLVPENDPLYTHTMEGGDDMPAHIKSMLTQTILSIPFSQNALLLGTWQGVYLWEHRHDSQKRRLVIHITTDSSLS